MENNARTRKEFFGEKIKPYDGELNEKYGGLSYIDDHLTHIDVLSETEASGFCPGIVAKRFVPFYAAKDGEKVGIGVSYEHAADALLFLQTIDVPVEDRIQEFVSTHKLGEKYTVSELRYWTRRLTLACYGGVEDFVKAHNLKDDDLWETMDYLDLVLDKHDNRVLRKVKDMYMEGKA